MEEKISKTKGCLFNEISFLLGLVFIKNIKFILKFYSNKKSESQNKISEIKEGKIGSSSWAITPICVVPL